MLTGQQATIISPLKIALLDKNNELVQLLLQYGAIVPKDLEEDMPLLQSTTFRPSQTSPLFAKCMN